MKKLIIILLVALPLYSNGQFKMSLDNNVTGSFNTTKVGDQPSLVVTCNNHFVKDNFYFDFNPYYNLSYTGQKLTGNELTLKENIGFRDEKLSVFIVHQYNSSYIRNISADNLIGVGVGQHFKYKEHVTTSVSYCILHQYRKYANINYQSILRNSFRVKLKLEYTNVGFAFEYYFQPNVNDIKDINIWGSSSIILFNHKPINFVIQHVYNYISNDKVKTIQSTSLGFKIKINKKTK